VQYNEFFLPPSIWCLNVVQMGVKVTGKELFDYVERFEGFQLIRATQRQRWWI